ncbi:hypothetical protein [Streptomyces luteireticuli]|uniref:hypothetical protein n=1 Tax=Streptomyces luteireticuli TaxID=173858 RepID=UPI00355762B4
MRTVSRNHTRIIARLQAELTTATRHNGPNDRAGTPVPVSEAWAAYDHRPRALLRELDARSGAHEIRITGKLRYELRPPAPAPDRREAPGWERRIDVVVDRDPDACTDVTVYLDGIALSDSSFAVHVIDPGASGPTHEWMESATDHADDVPEPVRQQLNALAACYHRHCGRESCTE